MLHLKDIGEFGLIRRYMPLFNKGLPSDVEGIGNDCAVIPFKDQKSLLVTTDLLIENTHFINEHISPEDLGYKSLSVNISDIAAMGGKPRYAFLSLALPVETSIEWIDSFMESFKKLADQSGILVLGGDTTRASLITINVLIMGEIDSSTIKRRSKAVPGDLICCTGTLGDSGGGLKILLEKLPQSPEVQPLIEAHFRPRPQYEEGLWLAGHEGVHAMMDISDGLASDLSHIMMESKCGAHVIVENLPISESLRKASARFNWDVENMAITGGEDYCLLLTVDPSQIEALKTNYFTSFGHSLNVIGTVLKEEHLIYTHHHKNFTPQGRGFDHFKS